jgi:hypothetical protein
MRGRIRRVGKEQVSGVSPASGLKNARFDL